MLAIFQPKYPCCFASVELSDIEREQQDEGDAQEFAIDTIMAENARGSRTPLRVIPRTHRRHRTRSEVRNCDD